jgi:uncharacterized membrane protein
LSRLVSTLVLAVAGVICVGAPAYAQSTGTGLGSESLTDYRVVLTVQPDGGLHVQEVIAYDFGVVSKHGIIRVIPDRVPYDNKNDRAYPISHLRVGATPGTPTQVQTSRDNDQLNIRIGDPNRTITGAHTYTIDYDVAGALTNFPDHVELYWNAIGTEWTVPISAAHVEVRTPATVTKAACYRGPARSNYPCRQAVTRGTTASYADGNLFPGEGVTVVAALPPGSVPVTGPILRERPSVATAFRATPTSLGLTGGVLGIVAVALGWLWFARGRDRRYVGQVPGLTPAAGDSAAETHKPVFGGPPVAVEFQPPDDLRPGQVGTLLDERASTLDVTATIIDLAVRKHLTIKEIEPTHWFGHKDWELTKLSDVPEDNLLRYERRVYDGLFRDRTTVRLSDLKRTFSTDLAAVEKQLYNDAVARGWFAKNPETVRQAWRGFSVLLLVAGFFLTIFLAHAHLSLVGLAVIVAGAAVWLIRNAMPARTAKGSAMLTRIHGFRTYLATAEAEQLKFEEREQLFARYLPFAIVFGITEHWAKVFENLAAGNPELNNAFTWYSGPSGWAFPYFAASMANFTTSANGVIAAHPISSGAGVSGFSGGGFSGGGGGGGGGGSW